jgi:hypothetical protein
MVLNQCLLQCFIVSSASIGAATESGCDTIDSMAGLQLLG